MLMLDLKIYEPSVAYEFVSLLDHKFSTELDSPTIPPQVESIG